VFLLLGLEFQIRTFKVKFSWIVCKYFATRVVNAIVEQQYILLLVPEFNLNIYTNVDLIQQKKEKNIFMIIRAEL
jgi:hypothetical protein